MTIVGNFRAVRLFEPKPRVVLGIMSGMSMDGLDLALVSCDGRFPEVEVKLLSSGKAAYPNAIRARLLEGRSRCDAREVSDLNMAVGRAFADAAVKFLADAGRLIADVDVIGSHGQTLVHVPPSPRQSGSTLQLGPPSVIAELTGIPTVGNFRVRDMARLGHGAPLIPLLDYTLFRKAGQVRALNNLGSISNVTVVSERWDQTFGFDTGPANMPLDHFARRITGKADAVDLDGVLSRQGRVHSGLLHALLALPYFKATPPKSAGYDDFGPNQLDALAQLHPDCKGPDLVRTALEFTVETMAQAYESHVLPRVSALDTVLLTGGGAHNTHLLQRLRARLPGLTIDALPDTDRAMNEAKEAAGMALLAHLFLDGVPGNLPSVTGAQAPVVLGELAL